MLKVGQLIKFIADLNPNHTPARLALYNFLKGFMVADDLLTAQVLNQFFTYTLDYTHWQQNKTQLSHEVKFLLQNFNNFYQQKIDLTEIRFPENIQIIDVELFSDLVEIVDKYVVKTKLENQKHRLISDQNKRVIALVLDPDGSIQITTFDKKCVVRNGSIEPLRTNLSLYYNSELELDPNFVQRIEVAPYITAQFKVVNGRCLGGLIRGYVFQKFLELKGEHLTEQPKLFYPVKRIEQFFVDRRTDPYYSEITSVLERTVQLVQSGDPEALRRSTNILNKAEIALENIFVGDKLLSLLIRDLKNSVKTQPHLSPLLDRNEECEKLTPMQSMTQTLNKPYDLIN